MTDAGALRGFIEGQLSVAGLREALLPHVCFFEEFDGETVSVIYHPGRSYPHVTFERRHVLAMLERAMEGEVSVEEMSAWANHITLLDFFDLAGDDPQPDQVWNVLTRMAHLEQAGIHDSWKLRQLRTELTDHDAGPGA